MIDVIEKIELYSPWILYGYQEIYRYIKNTFARKDEIYLKNRLLKDNKIIILTGPRRIGKTTLIYRIIYKLLELGIDEKRILYISLDDSDIDIKKLLDYYFKEILKESPSRLIDNVYVFIDEIQYSPESFRIIKEYKDISDKIKFFLSGSSSIRLTENVNKYLVGRVYEYRLYPIRFSEYVYRNIQKTVKEKYLVKDAYLFFMKVRGELQKYQKEFRERLLDNSLKFDFIKEVYDKSLKYKQFIDKALDNLMLYGSFPDYVYKNNYDPQLYKALLSEVFEKDLKLDIEYRKFLDILRLLSYQEFQRKNINTISNSSSLNYRTVEKILDGLERSFLINIIYAETSIYKRKSIFKVYFVDRGLRNSLLSDFSINIERLIKKDNNFYSSNSEALVLNSLYRILYKLGIEEPDIRFYLDENMEEIDFYYKQLNLWVEVKYQENMGENDINKISKLDGIKIIISKDELKEESGVYIIPLWLFLLLA